MSAFRSTMPQRYRDAFDASDAREHAAIVARRGQQPVHVEMWRRLPDGGAIICVVADDRPGLLSLISAALVARQMDVAAAKVFTRFGTEGASAEAIDFLWLRRDARLALPVLRADITRISEVLTALVTGEATMESVTRPVRPAHPVRRGASTCVTFDDGVDSGVVVLTVQTFDRPGLLLAITQALFRAHVQIIASDATTQNGRVVDRFMLVELDGSPIGKPRRGLVQMEVLSAIEMLARGEL